MPPLPPITKYLLIINVAVFFIDDLLGGVLHAPLSAWFGLWPIGPNFMPWQVVTYAFLHGDFFHLLFNMFGLWTFGAELERLWGQPRFAQFYAASVLSAAATQLLVTSMGGPMVPTVGASGGIFGLLLGFGMLFPNRQIMLIFPPIPMRAKTFVIVFGAIEMYMGVVHGNDGIAHFAHLGGMIGAFLMIRYWRGQPPFRRRRK